MEKWDVYDKDRNKTGETIEAGTTITANQFILVVHVVIFNSKNEMLIQRRHHSKNIFPNKWDLTVSGNVKANEHSRAAGERELLEELGYKINLANTRVSITFNFDQGFDDFYLVKKDIDLNDLTLELNEVVDVKWGNKQEILKMIDKETFLPYHKSIIELLFFNKDQMKIHTV